VWRGVLWAVCLVHIFDPSFMDRLWLSRQQRVDYAAVLKDTLPRALGNAGHGQQSVLDCSLLIAPCYLRGGTGHWTLVAADLESKTIMYVDPLHVCALVIPQQLYAE
jgi:hypothetical protein